MGQRRRVVGAVAVGAVGLVAVASCVGAWQFEASLPPIAPLANYEPPAVTVMLDRNGVVIGELYEERRYVLPIEEIPTRVQDAFIAAEDASFRSHWGLDFVGIARAAAKNVDAGRAAQGASTITQQVVKNLVLNDRQKSLTRKLKEVVLALEVEWTYEKDHILFLYLNSIYLGAQSYGVEAAARTYFGKHVAELTLGESAMLAGLPQRPSDYNPYRNFDRAKERQSYVLGRMVANGMVTEAEAEAARQETITLRSPDNLFLAQAPHFTEHVRRQLVDRFGEEMAHQGGLTVVTTCDVALQQAAQAAVSDRVTELDHESGYRRADLETLPLDAIPDWRREAHRRLDGASLTADVEYEAVVLSVANDKARVAVGEQELMLLIQDHRWISARGTAWSFRERIATQEERSRYWHELDLRRQAEEAAVADRVARGLPPEPPPDPTASTVEEIEQPGEQILEEGDLVRVKLLPGRTGVSADRRTLPAAQLVQDRDLEGALLSMELDTGAVRALVGGADFQGSQFNRATQGRRQVGSTFKPFVYAAAIESRELTAASVVSDLPVSIRIAGNKWWSPRGGGSEEPYTLAKALALSRNVVAVRTMTMIDDGMDNDVVYNLARRLGLGGPPTHTLPADWRSTPETQYLCPFTPENVSAVFCRDHLPELPEGTVMEEHRAGITEGTDHICRSCDFSLGLGSASLTLQEMVRAYSVFGTGGHLVEPYTIEEVRDRRGNVLYRAEPQRPQVLDPGVAHIVNFMLQDVIVRGTGHKARELGVTLAGKTGTTDDGRDAWFIGMSPTVITGVWIGFDTPQTIGEKATGGRIALPVWIRYMREVVDEDARWPEPAAESVVWAQVEETTGGRVTEGGRRFPFLPGTLPAMSAPTATSTETATPPTGLDLD
jgi:penicillin-binding protein 1A